MRRFGWVALALVFFMLAGVPAARAEKRIALLIGNQAYNPRVGSLKNPHTDVEIVGASLKLLGFEVTTLKDADYRAMDVAIKRFVAGREHEGQGRD